MSSTTPPPGMTAGMPPGPPLGKSPITGQPGTVPPAALPSGMRPGKPGAPPKLMSARPFIGRALKLLGRHKSLTAMTMLLSLLVTLFPFVVSVAFAAIFQILGPLAGPRLAGASGTSVPGAGGSIWDLSAPLFGKTDTSWLAQYGLSWVATPLTLRTVLIIWAGALVLSQVLSFLRSWIVAHLEARLLRGLQQNIYDHLQSLSLDFFLGGQTGALMQRVLSEAASVQRLLTQVLLYPLIDLLVLIIVLGYLLALSWQMTLVAFVLSPLVLLMFRYTSKRMQRAAKGMAMSGRELGAELEETISGISDIQTFNAQGRRSKRFAEASKVAARNSAAMMAWMGFSNSGAQIFIALSTALVLIVGIIYHPSFGLTLAAVIAFVQMTPQMFGVVQRLVATYTMYQSLVPNVVATYELLDTRPTVVEKPGAQSLGEVHGHVSFQNVVFGYSPTQKVLNGLSFDIREGETVSFVGPIGCGKSTILNLLLRFLDPESGCITVEGKDISEVTLSSLRDQVSKLSQFPFFLKDTIRENVRLGKADATDAEIEEACRRAHIHDVIVDPQRMPKGYDTVVDVQIPSGGQKRLIALARCLLRMPEVLLLDEPTENLDADQRNRLISVIREYAQQPENRKTCIVISHDLNFVAAVSDRIIVLNQGRVADEGTHDELIGREGLYKTLFELKNVDPALLRTRGGERPAAGPPPGARMRGAPPGMAMPV
ncbi:MAG TPA: ABC transporter transmembrane domain-containing protein [Pyrinomonadaceae bacterium]|nr:ABC transporter transmembrane domain-containing protein [Pyrinomonadaceae bacterium]